MLSSWSKSRNRGFFDDLLKAASGGSEKESRTKSRTNAIWPELIALEVHQRRIRALRQRAKTGPHEIQFNSGKTSNPKRRVENIQANRRDASGQKTAAKTSSPSRVYKQSGRPKGRPPFS